MNRNTESRYGYIPQEHYKRSKFHMPFDVKTSWNVGELIPLCKPIEVLPGDSWSVKTSKVIRMPALLTPIMQNVYLDTYWFFEPMRLTWEHTKEFFGENSTGAWVPQVTYSEPQVTAPIGGWNVGTLADYMGLPIGVDDISVSSLYFRGYVDIVNEFFRDENLQQPANLPRDDTTISGSNGSNYITDLVKGGKPFIACKLPDAFTKALPGPLKATQPVGIPLKMEPMQVIGMDAFQNSDNKPVQYHTMMGNPYSGWQRSLEDSNTNTQTSSTTIKGIAGQSGSSSNGAIVFNNLYAIPETSAIYGTINELRTAFQIQRLLEADARGGTRYIEQLRTHFGVQSPDARLQRPEYLGGNRIPLRVAQVLQQSETATTPQGTPTGVSLTVDNHSDFTHSFTEHGYLYCLGVVRYRHCYQDAIHPSWLRKERLDYYWPTLAHLGEVGIKNSSVFAQGSSVVDANGDIVDDKIFGYQEYAWEYRSIPSIVTGQMRSKANTSLDIWHLADDYSSLPYLSSSWIQEDKSNVDRVLSVSSAVTNQLFGDIHFECTATRVMPYYSVPGLIDHY